MYCLLIKESIFEFEFDMLIEKDVKRKESIKPK